ncbi:Thrombospondin-type laminin G domain and EAR repeat-containing protein [Bagarius yarrelli]|uniref:Thrombospondin-type laminin G domain and EAR repeat-containing protein n=1 Tax=Bagarius yarrelli TaxID=175774 RepID=A0A556V1F1_BAGYA|nr:Thrombospondin-type laminin G domain and EAR repeat-containing protein [Bagarius yarrelli]
MNASLMLLKLLFTCCCFVSSCLSTWRPCTGTLPHLEQHLLPLDLLHGILPVVGSHQTCVRMVQSQGSRGLKLSGPPQALSFPSSQIFTNCDFFPAEFSIVVTFKIPKLNPNKDEYIFTLLDEDSNELLVGLRLAHDKVHFLRWIDDRTERVTFRQVNMADGHWHTMVLALSGHYAILTLDCGVPVELQLEKPFPERLYTGGSTFFIGSRRRRSGLFSGLIRQLVLMPGSDVSSRLCPSYDPTLSVLSVPPILLQLPVKPSTSQLPLYPYEREKLDYLEDHQDIFTNSETFDIEVFHLPSLGLFIATANRDSNYGSAIYRWVDGRFQLFQNINTYDAQAWKFFTVGKKRFLVVANSRGDDGNNCELSVIYKWRAKQQRFTEYQKIQTHSARDWEAFQIHDDNFLAVANHREGEINHNIDSVIYRWNRHTRKFEVNQTISTSGAYDWEFFTIGPYHFLVVANTFNGKSTDISSTIYIWIEEKFQPFQSIRTFGAIDWEMFQIDNRFFLAVANSQKLSDSSTVVYNINSTIYELNTTSQSFIKFQDITTSSALDWEFFTVGDDKFLVVANSYDGASYSLNSVIYSAAVRRGIVELVNRALKDEQVKAVVFCGQNGIFCGGADIKEFSGSPSGPPLVPLIHSIEAGEKIMVAAVEGVALGGGLELALGCHYRVANAKPLNPRRLSLRAPVWAPDVDGVCEAALARVKQRSRGAMAPVACVQAVRAAATLPYSKGIEKERALMDTLFRSGQARAMQYTFFAQRKAGKWSLPNGAQWNNTKARDVQRAGVIGMYLTEP